jgi:hypothetical protein
MDSFDFNSLDSTTRDQTLEFLDNYDPTPLPDLAPAELGTFDWSMVDWSLTENPTWDSLGNSLGNADLSGVISNALTDTSLQGSYLPDPGWVVENAPHQQPQVMGTAVPGEADELR